jgi:hypothetical protein
MILVAEADSGVPMRGEEKLDVMETSRAGDELRNLLATRQYQIPRRFARANSARNAFAKKKRAAVHRRQPSGLLGI